MTLNRIDFERGDRNRIKRGFLYFVEKEELMKTLAAIFTLIAAFGLSACHTMQGLGKDVQSGGEALEKSAK